MQTPMPDPEYQERIDRLQHEVCRCAAQLTWQLDELERRSGSFVAAHAGGGGARIELIRPLCEQLRRALEAVRELVERGERLRRDESELVASAQAQGQFSLRAESLSDLSEQHDDCAQAADSLANGLGRLIGDMSGQLQFGKQEQELEIGRAVEQLSGTLDQLGKAHSSYAIQLSEARQPRSAEDAWMDSLTWAMDSENSDEALIGPSAEAEAEASNVRADDTGSLGRLVHEEPVAEEARPASSGGGLPMGYCPRCGSPITDTTALYCPRCGNSLQPSAAASPSWSSGSPESGAARPSPFAPSASPAHAPSSAPDPAYPSMSAPDPAGAPRYAKRRSSLIGSLVEGIGGAVGTAASSARDKLGERRRKRHADDTGQTDVAKVGEVLPSAAPVSAAPAPAPQATLSDVRFVGVAPAQLTCESYATLDIIMHEEGWEQVVEQVKGEHDEPVKTTDAGWLQVARQTTVRVELSSPELGSLGSEQGVWNSRYLRFGFTFMVPRELASPQVALTAAVYFNDVPATRLSFVLPVVAAGASKAYRLRMTPVRADVHEAFVSYASQDRARVATIIQGMRAARHDLEIFFDVETLRTGEDWERTLCERIEESDVFFLCWSRSASASEWVDFEWRYALAEKGIECIEPVAIDPPGVCPPPAELNSKHFNDSLLYIINAS